MSSLGHVGKRQVAAATLLVVWVLAGVVVAIRLGTESGLVVLVGANGGGLLILGGILLESGRRTSRDADRLRALVADTSDRCARDIARVSDALHCTSQDLERLSAPVATLDAHEERVLRYLNAMHARLELQIRRERGDLSAQERSWGT